MSSLAVQLLPYAVTAAISPILLTLEVVILASAKQPKLRAWFYALGGAAFILLFFALVLTLLAGLNSAAGQSVAERVVKIAGAIALVVVGIRQFIPRKTAGEQHQSRVQHLMHDGRARIFLVVGFLAMASNVSTLIIVIPALHHVSVSGAPRTEQFLALLELFAFVMLPMLIPVLLLTLLGHRADPFLHWLNAFMTKYARQITAIVCFVIALMLVYSAAK